MLKEEYAGFEKSINNIREGDRKLKGSLEGISPVKKKKTPVLKASNVISISKANEKD